MNDVPRLGMKKRDIETLKSERDQWRDCADRFASLAELIELCPGSESDDRKCPVCQAIAVYKRLEEGAPERISVYESSSVDDRLIFSIRHLSNAVLNECTCGGGGPEDAHTCPACRVYHRLVTQPQLP